MGGGAGGDARFVSRASIPLGSGGKPSNPLGDIPASNEEKSAKSPGPNAGGIGADLCGGAEDVEAEANARGGGTSVSRLPPLPPAAAARASRRSRAFRAAARASAASARERSTAAWRARSSSLIADARSSTDAGDGAAAASVSVFVSPAFNTLSSDALGISAAPKSSGNAPPANESPLAPLAPLSTRGMLGTLGMFAVPDPPTTSSKKFGGGSAKGGADGSECACRAGAGAGAGADARTGKNGFLMYAFAYPSRRWSVSSFFAFALGFGFEACLSEASPFAARGGAAAPALRAAAAATAARRPAAPSVPSSFFIFSSSLLVCSLFSSSAAASASNSTLRLACSASAACRTSLANCTFIADHSSHFHASFPSRSMTARRSPRVMRSTCATLCSASVASSDQDVWGWGEAVSGIAR